MIWITRPREAAREGRRLAIKDLFDTAGVRTTYGSAVFADHVPNSSAEAVVRLERAGWESAGKANLHEFAYGITSQNPHFGTVPNPSFPERTAGGSSGGPAAALAAGEADLGLGSDSGGSIRIPAACCELVGFKPSFGAVPMEGCFPLAPSFDHAGPLARDVGGCREAMEALAGVAPASVDRLGDLRIGLMWLEHASGEVAGVVAAAARLVPGIRRVGAGLAVDVFPAFQAEIAKVHRDLFEQHRARYGSEVAAKIRRCLAVPGAEHERALRSREELRADFERAFSEFDLLVAPTLPDLPPPAECDELRVRERMTLLTFPLNAVGAPALAIPCGRSPGGLPVSLQLIGRPGADGLVLAAAELFEAALRNTAAPNRSHPGPKEANDRA